jgi:hypothetical protein
MTTKKQKLYKLKKTTRKTNRNRVRSIRRKSKTHNHTVTYKTIRQRTKAHKKRTEEKRYLNHLKSQGKNPETYKPKEIYLKQILLTPNIKAAVTELKPDISEQLLSGFYTEKDKDTTFPLGRIENMMSIQPKKFDRLLKYEPVDITPHLVNGKKTGIKIQGEETKQPVYHLINGRHRLVRSIIEGRDKINSYEMNK